MGIKNPQFSNPKKKLKKTPTKSYYQKIVFASF